MRMKPPARLAAVEWDTHEARIAVAARRAGRVVVEHAFTVSLRGPTAGSQEGEVDIGGRIAAAMALRHLGRIDTLVVVGRAQVELRQLSLPPAPDEELPTLVRFQALREFNELEEDWPLDFIPLDQSAEGGWSVLAAAIPPALVASVQATCARAALRPRRLVLGPCATAALYARRPAYRPEMPVLLVGLLADGVDLTVLIDRKVVFLRSTRLSGPPLEGEGLAAEIRRTMVAAQNQLGGRGVESLVLCGTGPDHAAAAERLRSAFDRPVELFDPFAGLALGPELDRALPDAPGRFAPLLGALVSEVEESGQAIDFLHPRQPPPPPSRFRQYAAAAAGLGLLAAAALLWYGFECHRLVRANQELDEQCRVWEQRAKQAEQTRKSVAEIETWTASDIVWLDELARLSSRFPEAREARLRELTCAAMGRRGTIELDGLARSAEAISRVRAELQDETHRVVPRDSGSVASGGHYSWQFSATLSVEAEGAP